MSVLVRRFGPVFNNEERVRHVSGPISPTASGLPAMIGRPGVDVIPPDLTKLYGDAARVSSESQNLATSAAAVHSDSEEEVPLLWHHYFDS